MGYFTCKCSITCPSPTSLVSNGCQNRSTLYTWNWNESTPPPVQSQREQPHLTFRSHRFPRFQSVSVFCFLIRGEGGVKKKKASQTRPLRLLFQSPSVSLRDGREACLMNSSIHREPCVIPLCTSTQGATERGEKGKENLPISKGDEKHFKNSETQPHKCFLRKKKRGAGGEGGGETANL